MSSAAPIEIPVFSVPVRWALRVLACTAFFTSAYLAWHAVNQTSVAGCGIGSGNGCDMVLASKWSKWLGMPVAVAGLACYATLAGLSVMLGVKSAAAGRWINTAFVSLATLAAGASLWFIGLQVIAIGSFCIFCLITDVCGIAIGALTNWSAVRWLQDTSHLRRARTAQPGLMALRSAALPVPGAVRTVPVVGAGVASSPAPGARREWPTPMLPLALGGAGALLFMLMAGQIVFPAKTYHEGQVALDNTIDMDNGGNGSATQSADAQERTAMRPPTDDTAESTDGGSDGSPENPASKNGDATEPNTNGNGPPTGEEPTPEVPVDQPPAKERLVKFLNGKLTLDVYKHPLIGSPEAKHVMVEMVSYDCPHCRKMHSMMKQAQRRYGDQVAIIVMIVPLERTCNKLIPSGGGSHPGACSTARLAVGVATLKPSAFVRFHDWLMSGGDKPPSRDRIVTRAYSLVDRARLRELTSGDAINKQVGRYIELFDKLSKQKGKKFGLPVQILGDNVVTGSMEKPDELYSAWEKNLGVKPTNQRSNSK